MNDHENLSALVDDELNGDQVEEAIDRMISDETLRRRYSRYLLIGELLRGRTAAISVPERDGPLGGPLLAPGFAERVMAAIPPASPRGSEGGNVVKLPVRGDDGTPSPSRPASARPLWPALAASIVLSASAGFLVARQIPPSSFAPRPAASAAGVSATRPGADRVSRENTDASDARAGATAVSSVAGVAAHSIPAGARNASQRDWAAQDPRIRRRLQSYLVAHSEFLGGGMQGMLPYARVVALAGKPGGDTGGGR